MKYRLFICILIISASVLSAVARQLPYKNPSIPVEERVEDLLSRMTLKEKFWQLFMIPGDLTDGKERYMDGIFGFQVSTVARESNISQQMMDYGHEGTAQQMAVTINEIQKFFVEESRLGIPIIAFDEALHGLVRGGATAFPQAIALAATWDTSLVSEVAHAITMETKSRGIRQILSPVLDLARDVRWGRVEETYGEDPFLATQMASAFIGQIERNDVIATPKHFVANSGDGGRDSYPIHYTERYLEEIYLPPYKEVFTKTGTRSVMTAYNSIDGTPSTSNSWLLRDKLKHEWGFDGFVISDAGATGGANVLHFTAADYAESTKHGIEGGLDVIFQTSYDHYPLFWEAFEKGMVCPEAIDDAVRRVLRAKFNLGLFENPYIDPEDAAYWNGHVKHRELALESARKSVVLLKNDKKLLPLSSSVTAALIGFDAKAGRLGGYSGPGNDVVTLFEGMQQNSGADKINYSPGVPLHKNEVKTIESQYLSTLSGNTRKEGLTGEYFSNITLAGEPELTRVDRNMNFGWTLFSPSPELDYDWYSVRWTGSLTAPESGTFNIGAEGNDGYRLYLDGELLIDNWFKQSHRRIMKPFKFRKGATYDIKIEFYEPSGNSRFRLVWDATVEDETRKQIADAVKTARRSDIAVIAAGIHEGEFQDRAFLGLPGHQEELILAVAATGKPVVVVLYGGSAITMTRWMDKVDAIIMAWYPGEAGGYALADVLYGNENPGGRLPVTFPVHVGQAPLFYNHKPTGRGDDYYDLTGMPMFPFGFGLTYTEFEYGGLSFSSEEFSGDESITVSCTVRNSGKIPGDEVVQLYIRDELSSVSRPVKELKGFQRIHLQPGEEKTISFTLGFNELSMLDREMEKVVEPGNFRIMIGASSSDIRLRGIVKAL
jgi:beta-glucosidase